MVFNAVDLFCGAGGFSLGLSETGFSIVGALDNWKAATESYRANFSHPVLAEDIKKLSASDFLIRLGKPNTRIDLVVGGPPCQGFSVQRIGPDEDHRNSLVLEFARFVTELNPLMFLMENVPGLLGKRGRRLAEDFEHQLTRSGFCVRHQIINAAEYGVPQFRRRVLFWGWRKGQPPFALPSPPYSESEFRTVREAISELPTPRFETGQDALHRKTRLSDLNLQRLKLIPPGGGFESLPIELRVNCHRGGASKIGHRYVYGRLAPDEPAGTITARFDSFTRGKFGHPWEDRNLTLREGARLQSFPDRHIFLGTQEEVAALIGNAVPPLVAAAVCNAMMDYLSDPKANISAVPDHYADQFELFRDRAT